jgi:glucose-6-phosphate 1-dehydrogenase
MALASPPPQTLVVFGASGDLARRKLFPALDDLGYEVLLPERCAIVGSGGSRLDEADFRERARGGVDQFSRHRLDDGRWQAFAQDLSYLSAPLDDPVVFAALRERLVTLDVGAVGPQAMAGVSLTWASDTLIRPRPC